MPKSPVRSREVFACTIRGSGNAGNSDRNALSRFMDWNVVVTELGAMVEPAVIGQDWGHIIQGDVTDFAFNAIRFTDEGSFQNDFGTGGQQLPCDYNA